MCAECESIARLKAAATALVEACAPCAAIKPALLLAFPLQKTPPDLERMARKLDQAR